MTYTLADAIRDEFERTHPRGKNTLLCISCRRRKDRNDFRETPWYGRAACCKRCEGMRWTDELRIRESWLLDQERDRSRMYRRHISYLKLRRILEKVPSSADAVRAIEDPYVRIIQKRVDALTRAMTFAVQTYEENS